MYLDEFRGYTEAALFDDEARAKLAEWSALSRTDL
ncbi:hypothetical protein ABIA38_007456 [Embleya sp. AB8]